jgi:hypothetical protein
MPYVGGGFHYSKFTIRIDRFGRKNGLSAKLFSLLSTGKKGGVPKVTKSLQGFCRGRERVFRPSFRLHRAKGSFSPHAIIAPMNAKLCLVTQRCRDQKRVEGWNGRPARCFSRFRIGTGNLRAPGESPAATGKLPVLPSAPSAPSCGKSAIRNPHSKDPRRSFS